MRFNYYAMKRWRFLLQTGIETLFIFSLATSVGIAQPEGIERDAGTVGRGDAGMNREGIEKDAVTNREGIENKNKGQEERSQNEPISEFIQEIPAVAPINEQETQLINSDSENSVGEQDISPNETLRDRTPSESSPTTCPPVSASPCPPIPASSSSPTPDPNNSASSESPCPSFSASPCPTVPASSPLPGEVRILAPTATTVIDAPATAIVLQYLGGSEVELQVNGEAVDMGLIGRTETDTSTNTITQTWYGVPLQEGENTVTAKVSTNGVAGVPVTVKMQVRGKPVNLTVATLETRIPADGRSTATIKGQLLDARGNRSNRDAVITLNASAGEFVGADYDRDRPGFQVKAIRGEYSASLRGTLKAEKVRIRAATDDLEAFTQLSVETDLRPPIATGVVSVRLGARGTDFYRSFDEFLPPDEDNRFEFDVRAAAFATGRIGDWLFTGAINTSRTLNEGTAGERRLYGDNQFSEQAYPVYGDSSTSDRTTPSQDSVYLSLERTSPFENAGTDYFMWGDYDTEEFATEAQQITATTRQLHGFKANYNLGNLQISALYGDNVEGFQRDTIAPDGTSGYYFLSRRQLVSGSENVFIELEELNRPGTVVSRTALSRTNDYDIDYDRGTLLFREPILRTDIDNEGNALVRRIVVTYQFENQGNTSFYAGRLRYHFSRELDRESWIGATYLREDQDIRDFELYGFDALVSLGAKSRLIAEFAHSSNNSSEFLNAVSGSAYRLELEGELFNSVVGRAYFRSTDAGFTNNATTSFVPGQTRYGAQLTSKITRTTNLRFQYDHEDNFGIAPRPLTDFEDLINPGFEPLPGTAVNNSLTTVSAGVQQKIGKANLQLDWIWRDRRDRLATEPLEENSSQLRSRFTYPLTNKLTFQALNELNLGSSDPLYPGRTLLGLDWSVMPGIKLRLSQQFFSGGEFDNRSITSLDTIADYKLGENTDITGRFSVLGGANNLVGQGALGLKHKWAIAPGLSLDLAYEYITGGDYFGLTGTGVQFSQPYAVGSGGSSVGLSGGHNFSVGFAYTDNPDFKASARYDYRTSSGGTNSVITAGLAGKITPALTALARYQQASSSNQTLEDLGNTINLRVGLAYRDPNNDKFNALLRYEFRQNPSTIPDTILFGSGTGYSDHTFALETIFAPNWRWELYSKVALRKSTSYLADDFVGDSTILLGQLRATYRLNKRWDFSGEIRGIGQSNAGYNEIGAVAEVGYYMTPDLRLALGYSFGEVSDRDFNNSRSTSGPYLGLTVKVNELIGGFGLQDLAPPQQREVEILETLNPDKINYSDDIADAFAMKKAEKMATWEGNDLDRILKSALPQSHHSKIAFLQLMNKTWQDLEQMHYGQMVASQCLFQTLQLQPNALLDWYFSPQLSLLNKPPESIASVKKVNPIIFSQENATNLFNLPFEVRSDETLGDSQGQRVNLNLFQALGDEGFPEAPSSIFQHLSDKPSSNVIFLRGEE